MGVRVRALDLIRNSISLEILTFYQFERDSRVRASEIALLYSRDVNHLNGSLTSRRTRNIHINILLLLLKTRDH